MTARPTVDVTGVDISPNPAKLTDELNLQVDFHLDVPVHNGFWNIELGQTDATNYASGDNQFRFSCPKIDVSGFKSSQLTNCGLLIAALKDDNGNIFDLKMVIQVLEQLGALQRIVYSPLE
ncbi:hypothetical protein CCR75_003601 [Bremia lactucae]|uniref:Uncharacterized protein n=1 Tax=Bremia lactucae TaxID=4779 RepID=A0A976IBA8_BRELC|nr:hypothetical protein CCR75_003601 [Bremia lactucae]